MSAIDLRRPTANDAVPVRRLALTGGTLEANSTYAYASSFRHFAATCVVAQGAEGQPLGFVLGYPVAGVEDRVFVWQIGVAPEARGEGLATRMLERLLARRDNRRVRWLEATVTPSNLASQSLFQGLARRLGTRCEVAAGFSSAQLGGDHEPENLYRIGAIDRISP